MIRHILLTIPYEWGYGRSILRALYRWAKPRRSWVFSNAKRGRNERPTYDQRTEPVHAVVALEDAPLLVGRAREWGVPLLDLSAGGAAPAPRLGIDEAQIASLAVETFRARGYRHLAACDLRCGPYAAGRVAAFAAAVADVGQDCAVFVAGEVRAEVGARHPNLIGAWREIQLWLQALPRPLAVFAASDETGNLVCEVCRRAGIRVPEDVAVLGVDDDDLYALQSFPALSSLAVPGERVGVEVARWLDRALAGEVPTGDRLLPPLGLVARRSTEASAIADPLVAAAMDLIAARAVDGLGVPGLLRALGVGRRQLEQRFRAELGSSPHAEIRRHRIERARELLATTDLPLEAVAAASGFGGAARLAVSYRQLTGTTPGAWRRSVRG